MIDTSRYKELTDAVDSKEWAANEDNYFIVYHVISKVYMTFSVNDFFVDPSRRYYTRENAFKLMETLNKENS